MKKLIMVLVAILAAVGLSIAVVPPASATWTNSSCKQVDVSTVCLDFNSVKLATNSYRVDQVRLCLYSQTPNNNDDVHNNHVNVKGGSGQLLISLDMPTVSRNTCQVSNTGSRGANGGSAMTGHLTSTLNINPWPPLSYPDIDFTMCRMVTQAGLC